MKTTKWTFDQRKTLSDSAQAIAEVAARILDNASKLSPNPSPEFQQILEDVGTLSVAANDVRLTVRESIPADYR